MRAAISLLKSSHEKSGPMLTHASNIASSVSGERFCTDIKIVAAAKAPSRQAPRRRSRRSYSTYRMTEHNLHPGLKSRPGSKEPVSRDLPSALLLS